MTRPPMQSRPQSAGQEDGDTIRNQVLSLADANAASAVLFVALLRALSSGDPVELSALARAVGSDVAAVEKAIRDLRIAVERDEEGRIIGSGLTLRPTKHAFEIHGKRLYTWCALDALLFPAVLGVNAHVTSPCAATGLLVRMEVTPDGVRNLTPAEAHVVVVAPTDGGDVRDTFCAHVSFFASRTAAIDWCAHSARKDTQVLTVDEAHTLALALAQRFGTAARGDSSCCKS